MGEHAVLASVIALLLPLGCFRFDASTEESYPVETSTLPDDKASAAAGSAQSVVKEAAKTPAREASIRAEDRKTFNAPRTPIEPEPLAVEGFHPASHVGPDDASVPRPVTIVLHGNFDRPEWQCAMWKPVAGFHGWILCPRGSPNDWAPPSEDRWLYRGQKAVEKEVDACLSALEKRYPGLVSREEMVLAGFSLGAIYAPTMAIARPGMYRYLFLVEGGADRLEEWHLRALKRAGVEGIGMAMSTPKLRSAARSLIGKILKRDMGSVLVDMKGAGHNYRSDFNIVGRKALSGLVGGNNREQTP